MKFLRHIPFFLPVIQGPEQMCIVDMSVVCLGPQSLKPMGVAKPSPDEAQGGQSLPVVWVGMLTVYVETVNPSFLLQMTAGLSIAKLGSLITCVLYTHLLHSQVQTQWVEVPGYCCLPWSVAFLSVCPTFLLCDWPFFTLMSCQDVNSWSPAECSIVVRSALSQAILKDLCVDPTPN